MSPFRRHSLGPIQVLRDFRGPAIQLADALLAAILAPVCACCSTPLNHPTHGPVCESCWSGIPLLRPPFCRGCGDSLQSWRVIEGTSALCPTCIERPGSIDHSAAAGRYDGSLRLIIHALKYDGRRSLAPALGRVLRAAGSGVLAGADCIVPIPLHPWRQLRRGFNQAAELAACLDRPVVPALWRTQATRPQSGLSAGERRRNVRNAFGVSPMLSRANIRRSLVDRVVVLVDDVRTTGATLESCAETLKCAGAREVRALTLALAPPRHRDSTDGPAW